MAMLALPSTKALAAGAGLYRLVGTKCKDCGHITLEKEGVHPHRKV